jgi:hypothetical protein
MASHRTAECDLAEQALVAGLRLTGVTPDAKGYCASAENNLIAAVTAQLWQAAKTDLEGGRGTELTWKFRAAYSSSALGVNTFAPMQNGVDIPGIGFINGKPRFEQERSGGPSGWKPTLDVVIEDGDIGLFVESKCREYLDAGEADFSVAWPRHAAKHLPPEAARVYGDVYAGTRSFQPVDAPQLLKDVLAAYKTARDDDRRVVLLYAYWEPTDANSYDIFERHRDQADVLFAAMSSDQVTALAMSYRQLWDHWDKAGEPHITQLRERYDVPLASSPS